MTICAIWYSQRSDSVWCVADTRISADFGEGGVTIRTDCGPKIFPLPIVTRPQGRASYFGTRLGFAYSGSSLPAMMTYSTLSAMTSYLTGKTSEIANPPRIESIVSASEVIAKRFCTEYLASSNGKSGEFAFCIFGWCPYEERYKALQVSVRFLDREVAVVRDEHDLYLGKPILLGSGKADFERRITVIDTPWHPEPPKHIVEQMVDAGKGDVGGSLSIGIAHHRDGLFDFELASEHDILEPEGANRSYNGFDLDQEIGAIDRYVVGMLALPRLVSSI